MNVGFDGDVVVITGAGRGIGREHAKLCARLGARVVVNDAGVSVDGNEGDNPADLVVAEIREAGGTAVASRHSIDEPTQAKEIIDLALGEFGELHAVVHNAGILRDRTFHNLSDEDIERVMAVHLIGAFNVLRPAVAHMREQRYGRIVLTSSASGLLGTFGQSNYGAAKMGLIGLMNVLALEGASRGILVNSLAPSARTRMTEELLGPLADALDPVHVAPLVAYLASRSCSVSREIFAAGGGRYARMFVGVSPGWTSGHGNVATVDDIAANFETIRSTDGFVIANSGEDELGFLRSAINAPNPGPVPHGQ
ncbi:MAG: SDR family NAD(P)-dependent oxidoreductase [Ilumatobacteraceae bacterium]|jgi:NAD(P)-dependent dehydrogenase (short-subunit alcohol dehydrogenase family)